MYSITRPAVAAAAAPEGITARISDDCTLSSGAAVPLTSTRTPARLAGRRPSMNVPVTGSSGPIQPPLMRTISPGAIESLTDEKVGGRKPLAGIVICANRLLAAFRTPGLNTDGDGFSVSLTG